MLTKFRSIPLIAVGCTAFGPWYPLIEMIHLLKRLKLIRLLMKAKTSLYFWPFLWLIFSAKCLSKWEASLAIPPVVLKTFDVKLAFLTSKTHWFYSLVLLLIHSGDAFVTVSRGLWVQYPFIYRCPVQWGPKESRTYSKFCTVLSVGARD